MAIVSLMKLKCGPKDLIQVVPGRESTAANPELENVNMERAFKKQVRENIKEMEKTGEREAHR